MKIKQSFLDVLKVKINGFNRCLPPNQCLGTCKEQGTGFASPRQLSAPARPVALETIHTQQMLSALSQSLGTANVIPSLALRSERKRVSVPVLSFGFHIMFLF